MFRLTSFSSIPFTVDQIPHGHLLKKLLFTTTILLFALVKKSLVREELIARSSKRVFQVLMEWYAVQILVALVVVVAVVAFLVAPVIAAMEVLANLKTYAKVAQLLLASITNFSLWRILHVYCFMRSLMVAG